MDLKLLSSSTNYTSLITRLINTENNINKSIKLKKNK